MNLVRRYSLLASVGLLAVAVMLGAMRARPSMSSRAAARLSVGLRYFDSTIVLARNAAPRGARGDALTVALGYLERLRVGTGDPLRLIDAALHDPRVDPWLGERLAWAMIGRTLRRDAYVVDPAALDERQLAFIDRAIRSASDPRVGELSVRLAYLIAGAKGTIRSADVNIATQAAALIRDRELALNDVRTLLGDASDRHVDVMSLLADRRAAQAFQVERPPLERLTPAQRTEAMNAAAALVQSLDTLDRVAVARSDEARAPLLDTRFAARLATLGAQQPPIAPIVITTRAHTSASIDATNEETLVATAVLARSVDDSLQRDNALAVLASAVAMRTYAQSAPWFAGDGGPDDTDLMSEFGLGAVSFNRSVPTAWRPYFGRELQTALRDMALVYPAASFDGLRIAFGTSPLPDSALAMHNPRTRTIELNVYSSSGTLAHELSHDLDWQTSRMLFAGGGYSTDRAMTQQRGALASSVRGLADARLLRPVGASSGASSDRPAELFARGADWFAATALAMNGRSDAFLTAVQDASLPGYAAGLPSAIGLSGSASLLGAIDQMTFVPDSVQAAFTAQWADASQVDPVLLVRRVLETPVPWRLVWRDRGSSSFVALPPPAAAPCIDANSAENRAREGLFMLAVDARAESAVMRRMRYRPMSIAAPSDLAAAIRAALITELRGAIGNQGVVPAAPASFRSTSASCAVIVR